MYTHYICSYGEVKKFLQNLCGNKVMLYYDLKLSLSEQLDCSCKLIPLILHINVLFLLPHGPWWCDNNGAPRRAITFSGPKLGIWGPFTCLQPARPSAHLAQRTITFSGLQSSISGPFHLLVSSQGLLTGPLGPFPLGWDLSLIYLLHVPSSYSTPHLVFFILGHTHKLRDLDTSLDAFC